MVKTNFLHDIRVFDSDGQHVVGHVVAVEEDGLQILADQAFDQKRIHALMLDDVTAFEPGKKAPFSATCELCDADEKVIDLYHVHLRFTHLSRQAREVTHVLR